MEGRAIALTERLALLIQLDAQGAVKGLESVGRAADRNLGRVESKLDKTGQKMQKAGVGMLAAAGLAATGLYKAGQSAAELEQAVGGTEAVFKDASGFIEKFAKDAARNMGLSEAAFRSATTRIGGQLKGVGFTIDESAEKSVELTQVAADLAATFGGTTAEAVDALGAAFRGEADPAERFNLRLNQNTVNAKAVELGLAKSTASVDAHAKAQATLALIMEQSADAQGQFARETDSASGAMAIAAAEIENAKASLGQAVAPIMATFAGGLADIAGGFTKADAASEGFLSKLATFGTIGLGAAGGASFVIGKLIELRGHLTKTEGGLTRLGKAGAVIGGAAAIAGLAAYEAGLDDITVEVNDLALALNSTDKATQGQLKQFFDIANAAGQLDDAVAQTAETNVLAAERLVDYAESAGIAGAELSSLQAIVEDKRAADIQAADDQKQYAEQMEKAAAAADESAAATENLTFKLRVQEEALEGVLSATLAQFDSNIGYRRSVDDVEDSLTELVAVQKEHGTNSEEYRDKLLEVESSLLDQAGAAVRLAEDQAKATGQTLNASEKTGIYRNELVALRDSLAPGSPLRVALDGYINRLNAIPANKTTDIVARFSTSGVAQDNRFQQFQGNANGTSFFEGGLTLVGERGAELVNLPRGSQVYDANRTSQMLGGASPTYITIQTGADPQAVVEAIKRYTRSNGPLPASLVG